MRRCFVIVCFAWLLPAVAAASTQCTINADLPKPIDEIHQTIAAPDEHPEIYVSTRNGNVQVTTWERNQIKIDVLKEAPNKQRADDVKINIKSDQSRVTIRAEFPVNRGWFGVTSDDDSYTQGAQQVKVHIAVTIPRGSRVPSIFSRCGNIELNGLSGEVHAQTQVGAIVAKSLNGSARFHAAVGRVSAEFLAITGTTVLA